jgi:membrane protein YqaA with SNARE-associated domain
MERHMIKAATTKLYTWATEKATSTKSPLWIGLLFFLELFLIIPLDAVLMFFCLQNPRKTFLYIGIAALMSTISGIMGYLLGHFLWDLIGSYVVPNLISASFFDRLSNHLQLHASWAVFIGSLFPFPLKAISLTSGAFHLNFIGFITGLFAARLLRFTFIGAILLFWKEKAKIFLDKHFHYLSLIIGVKIAAAILFFWVLSL